MQLRAGTGLEREQADKRTFVVEQAAAARARIEGRRGTNHVAAVVEIESFHLSFADHEVSPGREAGSHDVLASRKRPEPRIAAGGKSRWGTCTRHRSCVGLP